MKLLVKLIVGTVLVAITALFAVVIAVLLFVDPNDYRDEIAAVVERETGRTLS